MTFIEASGMRQRIIQESTILFARSGYSAISIREITKACGITKAALYYHFKDKEALIMAILTENLADFSHLVIACQAGFPTVRQQIIAFIEAIFALPVEKRAIIRLASQEMSNISPEERTHFGQLYSEQFIDPLARLMEDGMRRGELRSADPHQALWILLGMMYPFFYPGEVRPADLRSEINLMITIFFEGMTLNA
jgi:AcrR family transcriptional regulator